MEVIFHVFTPRGDRVGELTKAHLTDNVARTFAFNGEAPVLVLNIPRPLAREEMGQFGNLVVAESDTGVELWGGVMRGPRQWTNTGVSIQVRSWEAFLRQQQTPWYVAYNGIAAGGIVRLLLADLLSRVQLPLELGEMAEAGEPQAKDFRLEEILTTIEGLAGGSEGLGSTTGYGTRAFDWWIETAWDDNHAHPKGIVYLSPYAGRDSAITLAEGVNVESFGYAEDDDATATDSLAVGGGGIWGERAQASAVDHEMARQLVWQRTVAVIREDIASGPALQDAAKTLLTGISRHLVLGVNNNGGAWASVRSGDRVGIFLPSADYGGLARRDADGLSPARARVVGREANEATGIQTMQLVMVD